LKVSIITITYNSESTLIDTIDSVLNQTYKDIEYIIIDGKSTDSTVSIIHSYKDKATGDIIGVLHSDDFYTNHQVIEKIVQTFNLNQADAVYADLFYVDKTNVDKILRKWKSGNYKHGMFVNGWMPPHPTFFVRRHCYEKYGSFNLDLVSAADYELMLRFVHKHQIKLAYLPEFIIKMRAGGLSNASLSNRIRANKEDRKAWLMNGLKPKFHTLYLKPLRKIIQLFKR
jgi:glycosyltransferase involved in cell wall biosynthesis